MKKFFALIAVFMSVATQVRADVRSIANMEEAAMAVRQRNASLMKEQPVYEEIPTDEDELREYLIERSKNFDITTLQKGDRLDNPSSYSRVNLSASQPKKTFWEEMYDKAMERISKDAKLQNELEDVKYYTLTPSESQIEVTEDQVPMINIKLPDGMPLKVPAIEHVPLFSSQIEVLPNRMLKVYDKVVVVANGEKVQNGFIRFIRKRQKNNVAKIQVIPDTVTINGTVVPYRLEEQKDYYAFRPKKSFRLAEGVYVFEFHYFVDHALWNYGDFYEFYWNATGGHLNLVTARAIATIKLPGREPAVKRYVLTGQGSHVTDKNAVMMNGQSNITGFMNISPLAPGEGMHVFMTVPKVDFLPVSATQRIVSLIEEYGDIIFSAMYLLIVVISCALSWYYIRHKLKFRNVNVSSPLAVRALWRGGADLKSVGALFLDLFKKNVVDLQQQDGNLLLVRKSAHARKLHKFEKKIMKLLFSKKDSVCHLKTDFVLRRVLPAVKKETDVQLRKLGVRLSAMYICFNLMLLLVAEVALCLWNPYAPLKNVFMWINVLLLIGGGLCWLSLGKKWLRRFSWLILLDIMCFAGLLLCVYLHWSAALMLMLGVCIAFVFNKKASGQDAMLKNAVLSVQKLREFIEKQAENIESGRNFTIQQANIWALDLENNFTNNPKIAGSYRLEEVNLLMK